MRYQCSASWAVAVGRFPIFYLSKSHSDSRRAKRFVEALIIVPAVYLALLQQPAARSIALLSLGRKQGCTLARAMEGDRDIRRQNAPKGSRYSARESLDRGGLWRRDRIASLLSRASHPVSDTSLSGAIVNQSYSRKLMRGLPLDRSGIFSMLEIL